MFSATESTKIALNEQKLQQKTSQTAQLALEIVEVVKRFGSAKPSLFSQLWKPPFSKPHSSMIAVDRVSLTIERGEIFGLLGANGSGKSTLIRLVSTLLVPDSGQIKVFGYDVQLKPREVQRLINRVSVEASFFKKLSALENLLYAARLYDVAGKEARERSIVILEQLGLSEKRLSEPLEHMSRGMQQKVAVARGLLTSPLMLLLDEPTTGLDPRSKQDVQRFVLEMREQHATTVFLTTHDMGEADRMCDRIAVIDAGRIVALDTPLNLKKQISLQKNLAQDATMEEVFLALTGKSLDDDFESKEHK